MSNPIVSKIYKEEKVAAKSIKSLPSSEIVRSVNPNTRGQMENNSRNKPNTSSRALRTSRGSKAAEELLIYPDLEILKSALDSLFTSTYVYDDMILLEFMKGLGKLTINMLEDNGNNQNIIPANK